MLGAGMACQLTSPRPASWAGTPTAEAWGTSVALTQAAIEGPGDFLFTPTLPPLPVEVTPTPTVTATPRVDGFGPWLVFPAPDNTGLQAYDITHQVTLEVPLPEPIIPEDLVRGRSPDMRTLIVRAGSALNTDELALYRVDLPSFEVSPVTPLLSIPVQRKIVNEDGLRVFETLATVTRPDGLAWSPDGRFLAFSAALDGETSDLYVLDTLNDRVERLNGLFSQNATPSWSPGGTWLISQELNYVPQLERWRAELVTGLRLPGYDSQNMIYLPHASSMAEVFVGWLNADTFVSYAQTEDGPRWLRQVDMEALNDSIIREGGFQQIAFDPTSGVMAYILSYEDAIPQGLSGGLYRIIPDSPVHQLQQVGNWDQLTWDATGRFMASGPLGVTLFTAQGESVLLPDQANARLSPDGNWLIAWGDGQTSRAGARLFQSASSNPLQTMIEDPVEALLWQPDSKGFFIFSNGGLYHFVFPGLTPKLLVSGFPLESALVMIWVE
jgi:hypothetical protein